MSVSLPADLLSVSWGELFAFVANREISGV